jgi:hypothetical protein
VTASEADAKHTYISSESGGVADSSFLLRRVFLLFSAVFNDIADSSGPHDEDGFGINKNIGDSFKIFQRYHRPSICRPFNNVADSKGNAELYKNMILSRFSYPADSNLMDGWRDGESRDHFNKY